MTDDYWGPMPDDSEYPTPRERLDDGEADRLRALLRRWVATVTLQHGDAVTYRMPGGDAALVGDTLKELGE